MPSRITSPAPDHRQGPPILRAQLARQRSSLNQQHFRWRNDDGNETTATWRAAIDVSDLACPIGENLRLRAAIFNAGDLRHPETSTDSIQLQFRINGGAWTGVGATAAVSGYVSAFDNTATTQQISSGPFQAGTLRTANSIPAFFDPAGTTLEVERTFFVQSAAPGDLVEFRFGTVPAGFRAFDTYAVTPSLVMVPAESPVTRPLPIRLFPGQVGGPPVLTVQRPQDPDVTGPQTQAVAGRTVQVAYGAVAVAAGNANQAVAGRTVQVAYGAVTILANANLAVSGRVIQVTYGAVTPVPGNATKAVAGRTVQVAYGAVTATEPPEAPSIRALPIKLFPGRLIGPPILTTQKPVANLGQATPVAGRVVQVAYGTVTPIPGNATKLVAGRVVQVAYGTSTIVSGNATQAVAGRVVQVAYGTVTALVGGVTKIVAGRVVQVTYGTLTTTAGNATKLVSGRVVQVSYGAITTVAGGATKAVPGRVVQVAYGAVTATPGGGGGPTDANWKALIGVGP